MSGRSASLDLLATNPQLVHQFREPPAATVSARHDVLVASPRCHRVLRQRRSDVLIPTSAFRKCARQRWPPNTGELQGSDMLGFVSAIPLILIQAPSRREASRAESTPAGLH
jgi:hypothetical protein